MKSKSLTKPIYAHIIEAAGHVDEPYDRSERKDFWNDPDRWEGIDDPRKTMIWEVRRRDVIDVRPKLAPAPNPYQNAAQPGHYNYQPLQRYQASLLNQYGRQPGFYDPFGFRLGRY